MRARGRARRGPDHKRAGAKLAFRHLPGPALAIQGHHGGLGAWRHLKSWLTDAGSAASTSKAIEIGLTQVPDLRPTAAVSLPAFAQGDPLDGELFLRLLFSTLVDADFLDTERHFTAAKADQRGANVGLTDLWARFEASQERLTGRNSDLVSRVRHLAYEALPDIRPATARTVPAGGSHRRWKDSIRHGFRAYTRATAWAGSGDRGCAFHQHHRANRAGLP